MPVRAAPTTPSFSTQHLASMDWTETTAKRETFKFWDLATLILEDTMVLYFWCADPSTSLVSFLECSLGIYQDLLNVLECTCTYINRLPLIILKLLRPSDTILMGARKTNLHG